MVLISKIPTIDEPETGIVQFLFANKYKIPENRPLLIDALDTNRFLTFAQIKKLTLQFAAGLQDICEFGKGDVLAIFSPNQYDFFIPVYGAVAAGGITTTVNPTYNIEELHYQLSQTKAKVLICHEDNIKVALAAGSQAGLNKTNIFVFGDKMVDNIHPFQSVLIGEREAVLEDLTPEQCKETIALLCFSSGTSGRSKGVMTTHANLTSNITQYAAFDENVFNSKESNRMLTVLPFYHSFGLLVNLNYGLHFGTPNYVLKRFDIFSFCKAVQDHKITFTTVVPPICLSIAKHDIVPNYDLTSLKSAYSGAAPLGPELWKETMSRLPNLKLRQLYGLTETSPVAMIQPENKMLAGSAGLLFPNMTAKIVDDDGNEVTKYGERGELLIKGPNIMKGYLNNPEATAESIDSDGYFHTGDIVLINEEEHFFIVDRKKELIKYKGFPVAPAEIESVLLSNPIIADCAVIGVYDNTQATEIIRAYVTLKDQSTASEEVGKSIMKFVAEKVVHYKQVRKIYFVAEIPRNPSGKILRRLLRDTAQLENKKEEINKSKL
ncbi:uncharacterized protein EV154DRAFT_474357 [Mucor mucedo]|uniref:uncharacterized protein n=1 Tax=Mucor mucedo TaxID=29922 RepID=UPI00221FEB35|nr:uncharacterized protein EV154DRAFT_474357 [Mucor mucedo]KAI7869822.1 hypothetical protein EV154DRAFT_474357 [Mucor mucedo]